ncbi:MAG TPA: TetR family transcriptional regulator [Terracidiphilus sp.]|nr:TetR family transcriptional regulator [Terracidiphilus sp.]
MSSTKKPRLNQRQRTRTALVQAAMQAVERGETPTVEAAAEAAHVSRATAYRYFASQQALLLETSVEAIGNAASVNLIDEGPVESRVDTAIYSLVRMSVENEPYLRTFLMSSMEQWLNARKSGSGNLPTRQGRRTTWLDKALAPLHALSPREKRRLRTVLSMLCGIEALVVAKDVCGCTAKEAEEASRWAARAILRAALADARK